MTGIETALTYKEAIEIIPENITNQGIYFLQRTVLDLVLSLKEDDQSLTIIPIEEGGHDAGKYLCNPGEHIHLSPNPMQMSHYGSNNEYLGKPVCKSDPDILKIIDLGTGKTTEVAFAEAVVESQETIIEAMARINYLIDVYNKEHNTKFDYPNYHTFALVSKTDGDPYIIPEFIWAFNVVKEIWLHGLGCDDAKKGRKKKSFFGRLAPKTPIPPSKPYYTQNF